MTKKRRTIQNDSAADAPTAQQVVRITVDLSIPYLASDRLSLEQYQADVSPTVNALPSLYVSSDGASDDNCHPDDFRLGSPHFFEERFNQTNNPAYAIEAILAANAIDCYPPMGALRWLCAGLERWHSKQGKVSLDQVLGLKKGRGHKKSDEPFFKIVRAKRDERIAVEMMRLTCWNVTEVDAAELVAARMNDVDWNHTLHELVGLGPKTIIDRWRSEWRDKYGWMGHIFGRVDLGARLRYMEQFPRVNKHFSRAIQKIKRSRPR